MSDTNEKIEKLYCLAQDRFHERDLEHAITSLKALLQLDFNHLDGHFLLALIYQQDQAYELSSEHFRFCLEHHYDKKELHKLMAMNQLQLGLFQSSIYELQKHLHQHKEDDDAYALMGDVYMKQQEYTYAQKVYLQAIDLAPKNAMYYFKLSSAYKDNAQLPEAITQARKVLALESENHEALFLLANLYDSLHQYEEACKCYQKAIDIQPNIALYHNNLAVSLSLNGDSKQAKQVQEQAIKLEPKNEQFLNNLSKL